MLTGKALNQTCRLSGHSAWSLNYYKNNYRKVVHCLMSFTYVEEDRIIKIRSCTVIGGLIA